MNRRQGDNWRERWSSRMAFYFAAIGSAVGFGNVWRFPALVLEYGGAAFFVPYALAFLLIGLPILILEISLGQYYETGDVNVFGGIHRRLRGIGLLSIACGYMLVTYYSMLLAWIANSFFDSLRKDSIWARGDVTGSEAKEYFIDHIVGMSTLGPDLRPTRLVWKNIGYSLFTWAIIYLCVAFGIKWTGRISYITMGVPLVLLFIFLGRSVTLESSQKGIAEYIGRTDWGVLTNQLEVWSEASSQIIFSLSITFGTMTAYGSHCKRNEPALLNSCVVAASDSLFSLISGFVVFAFLGYLADVEGKGSVSDLEYSSVGLVFGSWPVALGTLPGGRYWVRFLFLMLFLLGIDSAFSLIEAFLVSMSDIQRFKNTDKKYLSLGLTITGWLLSFTYATDAGLIFLDTMDYYINFSMLLVAGFECFAAGWIYNIDEQIDCLGAKIVFSYMLTTLGSVFFGCVLYLSRLNAENAVWVGFAGLVLSYCMGMSRTLFLMKKKMKMNPRRWTWRSMCYDLFFRSMVDLRNDLAGVVGGIPLLWAVLIKYFIPPAIIVLFSLGSMSKTSYDESEFGNYGGYPKSPYQILGIFVVVFAGFLFFSSMIFPRLYDVLEKVDSPVRVNKRASSIFIDTEDSLDEAAREMWRIKRPKEKLASDLELQDTKASSPSASAAVA